MSATETRDSRYSWIGEWLLAFGLVVASVLVAKLFTRNSMGIAGVWLANGLVLAFALRSPLRLWPGLFMVSALGQLAGAELAGDTLRFALTTIAFHTLEIFIAAWFLKGHIASARDLSRIPNFIRFLGAAAVAPLASGLALVGFQALTGNLQLRVLDSWYVAHALGMATATPVMLSLRGNELGRLFRRENRLEVMAVTALIVLVTGAVFWQHRYPLQYLVFPPMLLAALRGGFPGTAFALIIVTAISATLTGLGRGPLMLLKGEGVDDFDIYLMLQVWIGVLMMTCFPVAVAMSAWRRTQHIERELRNQLRLLAEHSSDVVMLTQLDGKRVYVSPSVRDILGWSPEEFQRGTFRDLVHASHFDDVQRQLDELRQVHRGKATITFPTRRADGRKIWMEARVRYFRDGAFLRENDDRAPGGRGRGPAGDEGFVVTLRNITRRREAEQALENANRKLASMVMKDGLTGLGNRRHFDQLLAELWRQCAASVHPMAVIMLDVDHFKRYNDHYGHLQGDHCLREVARAIGGSVRDRQDFASRYGGEEFAVVLAHTHVEDALHVAERIRRDVEQLAIPHAGSLFGHVTVSIGVAVGVPHATSSADALVKSADAALYRSKEAGRNRVTSDAASVLADTQQERAADSQRMPAADAGDQRDGQPRDAASAGSA